VLWPSLIYCSIRIPTPIPSFPPPNHRSSAFNTQLRQQALEAGYTLNEYAIRRLPSSGKGGGKAGKGAKAAASAGGGDGAVGEAVPVDSERDVFALIGVPYVPPQARM
jgi:DNA polymerase beta